MPGAQRAIVIGGGINGVAPLAIDNFLFVTSINPPEASSSPRLIRRATSIEVLGDGAFSTAIGNNADANGDEAIVIGRDCSQSGVGAGANIVVIGQNMDHTGGGGFDAIMIGNDVTSNGQDIVLIGGITTPLNASNFVAIGQNMQHSGTVNGVIIGFGAQTSGSNAVAIGGSGPSASTNGTAIGSGAIAAGSNSIALGQGNIMTGTSSGNIQIGASCSAANLSNIIFLGHNLRQTPDVYAAGDVVIGNNNVGGLGFSSRVIWFGDVHTTGVAVPAAAMRWKNALGTDIAANDLTITGPRSTGNAVAANVLLQVGLTGASGAALQVATTVARLVGGAAPHLEVTQDRGLRFVNQTNAAGAAVGTLNNSPAAGDPTHWLKITVGGVNFAVPCWAG